jgi:hypothetical protein
MHALSSRLIAVVAALGVATPALAHHGLGRFDRTKQVAFTGVIRGLDFVNPHSYLHFDVVNDAGETISMNCEMRAATLLRRSGWSPEMFKIGERATVFGYGHRDDPTSCYLEDIKIGDGPSLNRNVQLPVTKVDLSTRPARLPTGEPNISGDWAQEQYVIAVPPGGGGVMTPKSLIPEIQSGRLAPKDIPPSGWDARPVQFTARGKAEADAFRMWSPEDNPRLRCRPTSILLDWVFDGPVNRIAQERDRIVINYGLFSFERVIHMDQREHPKSLTPSYAGHSIGRWEGDVLVVDTVGFAPGVIAPPVRNSDKLHVVERFSLDPVRFTLKRDYVAEDPVYFTDRYIGSDTLQVADVPYVAHPCNELTYEFRAGQDQAK